MIPNSDASMSDDLLLASMHDLYEDGPCGYLFTRPNGTVLRMNDTLRRWLGLDPEDLAGRRFQDLLTLPGRLYYENQYFPMLRLQGTVKEVAFDLIRPGQSPLPVLINSVLHEQAEGEPLLIASAVFDASDRRAYEQELIRSRRSAEQLAAVVQQSTDAIVRMSPTGIIETWNAGAAVLFGREEDRVAGSNLQEILVPADADHDWAELLADLRTGHPVQLDMVGQDASGERVDVSTGFTPHHDLLGAVDSVSVIMRNIAERRAIQRMQQEFLAVTTHELRSPITGIKGNAQLMQRRGTYNERAVTAIVSLAGRLERLVDDLLLVSQIEADRLDFTFETVDLVSAARMAVEEQAAVRATIRTEVSPVPVRVAADSFRLGQVITNLLTNAIKYSPDGTDIMVRVSNEDTHARLAVTDHGIGIPPDALPHLFERFYRVSGTGHRIQGLGLGLYICNRIVAAHGGHMEVTSEPGIGSTFSVVLPLQPAPTPSPELASRS